MLCPSYKVDLQGISFLLPLCTVKTGLENEEDYSIWTNLLKFISVIACYFLLTTN